MGDHFEEARPGGNGVERHLPGAVALGFAPSWRRRGLETFSADAEKLTKTKYKSAKTLGTVFIWLLARNVLWPGMLPVKSGCVSDLAVGQGVEACGEGTGGNLLRCALEAPMRKGWLWVALLATGLSLEAAERRETIAKQAPAREGMQVVVEAGSLDLAVRVSAIEEVRVEVELACAGLKEKAVEAWIASHKPEFSETPEAFKVIVQPTRAAFFKGLVVTKARMSLVVPPFVQLDLSSTSGNVQLDGELPKARPLRLRSASGDVEFVGYAPEVEARTTSGDIHLRFARPVDSLLVRTSSGDVEVTGGAKLVRADSSSGELRMTGLLGPVGVATTSGDVALTFDALPEGSEVRVTTASGKVRLTLPPGTKPGGEVSSVRGEIRSSYPGETPGRGGKLLLAGEGPRLFVSTTSGRIELY